MQMSNRESNHNLKAHYVHILYIEDPFMKEVLDDVSVTVTST